MPAPLVLGCLGSVVYWFVRAYQWRLNRWNESGNWKLAVWSGADDFGLGGSTGSVGFGCCKFWLQTKSGSE